MDFDNAVKQIVSRVEDSGVGTPFSYEEVNQWLGILSGDDLMWAYDKLADRLVVDHRISLELKEDSVVTVAPEISEIEAAEKRSKQ